MTYMTSLAEIMPCSLCANEWRQIAPTVASATDSRYTALKWTIDVHNAVNKRLHKPVLTYAEAVDAIKSACPGNVLGNMGRGATVRRPLTGPGAFTDSEVASSPLFLGVTIAFGAVVLVLVVVLVIVSYKGNHNGALMPRPGGSADRSVFFSGSNSSR